MAQLIVRNLDEALVKELKLRAAQHGLSAEAEHRAILEAALRPARSGSTIKDVLLQMPSAGADSDFERTPGEMRRIDL